MKKFASTLLLTCTAILAAFTCPTAWAACPYDHLLIGHSEGALAINLSQLYRHWNSDWGVNSAPFAENFYEFSAMFGGGWIRVEPGFALDDDPETALPGTLGVDYDLRLVRVSASDDLRLYDDFMTEILAADGDSLALKNYDAAHLHVRYVLAADTDPELPRQITFRLRDALGRYEDSPEITVHFGAAPPPVPGDADGDGHVNINDFVILKQHYNTPSGATWVEGDFNDDGAVDIKDFIILKKNYNT